MGIQLEDKDENVMTCHGVAVLEIDCFIYTYNTDLFNNGDYCVIRIITINGNTTVAFRY